ncbi:MAG: hypothetical protein KDA63_08120 [Planctomycetales bacterium]|nr:hypothetical protein [Planctomycetales bacterium]
MFNKLATALKALAEPAPTIDPATFGDPLALDVSWEPLKRGGTNFATHRLSVSLQRCAFRATWGAIIFYLIFLVSGLAASGVGVYLLMDGDDATPWFAPLVLLAFGALFGGVGGALFFFGTRPVVFDRQFGWFYKGHGGPPMAYTDDGPGDAARLVDIHALQIVREYVSSNDSSYYSYELNLVLGDGKRVAVVDHGNRQRLRDDAAQLAEFLDVPLWDATTPAL